MAWWHRQYSDFSDEVSSHITLETDRLVEEGLSPVEARAAAIRRFGNPTSAKESFYESRQVFLLVEAVRRHLRCAVRRLAKTPAFTLTAILTLGFGAGSTAAIFTVAESLLSQELPVTNPEELVLFRTVDPAETDGGDRVPEEMYYRLVAESRTLSGVLATRTSSSVNY